MTDKTTEGHMASTDEVERMLRNLCAYALSEPDPLRRYFDLTHQQVVFDGVVAALRRERGKALADLADRGHSLETVAERTGLETPKRVRTMIASAGRSVPVARASGKTSASGSDGHRNGKAAPAAPLLPPTAGRTGVTRMLTPEERVALGLPAQGPITRTAARRTRQQVSSH